MKWQGDAPEMCDLCEIPLSGYFVDGKTKDGPWALMCLPCHKRWGMGLGLGKGQKYNLQTLEKEEG